VFKKLALSRIASARSVERARVIRLTSQRQTLSHNVEQFGMSERIAHKWLNRVNIEKMTVTHTRIAFCDVKRTCYTLTIII